LHQARHPDKFQAIDIKGFFHIHPAGMQDAVDRLKYD